MDLCCHNPGKYVADCLCNAIDAKNTERRCTIVCFFVFYITLLHTALSCIIKSDEDAQIMTLI